MKVALLIGFCLAAAGQAARATDEFFDRVDGALTVANEKGTWRGRLSGTAELNYLSFQQPAPGLIESERDSLLNPSLNLYLDAQLGTDLYAFVQGRVDQGFDPSPANPRGRLDEYALRYTVGNNRALTVQIGKFATVVGNWVARHQAWDNPFVTAPLPYENPTGIFDTNAATTAAAVLDWSHVRSPTSQYNGYLDHYRVPVVWGPSYASGAAFAGAIGRFEYAAEIKNASLSSRPQAWDATRTHWQHPTLSSRLGYRPDAAWNFGLSASTGTYLQSAAEGTLAPGRTLADYRQIVFGQDLSYAWHHWQFWAEAFESRFEIPEVGNADTFTYYLETKYKFTPRCFGALRWNQQIYGTIADGWGGQIQWARAVRRVDCAVGYRFSAQTQLKVQFSVQDGGAASNYSNEFAAQFVVRF